jgi:peptidyl-prolyl cis-trans isomerase C
MKKASIFTLVSLLGMPLLLGSCRKESFTTADPAKERVIARVNGIPITDVDFKIRATSPSARAALASERGRQGFLDVLIRQTVIAHMAKRAGYESDPAYQASMRMAKMNFLNSIFLDTVTKHKKFSKAEILKRYSPSLDVSASRIVLKSAAEARKAQALLKAGESFSAVAQKMSTDIGTAGKGGDAGRIWLGNPRSVFERTLLELKDGRVSDVVRTDKGYELIRRDGTATSSSPSPGIMEMIRLQLQQEYLKREIDNVQTTMKIEIDRSALNSLSSLAIPEMDQLPYLPE